MDIKTVDYDLPKELIAQDPLHDRTGSRLMVLRRESGRTEHRHFEDLPEYLGADDILVYNNTRVIPARLRGERSDRRKFEFLLVRNTGSNTWEVLVSPRKKIKAGDKISFNNDLSCVVADIDPERCLAEFSCKGALKEALFNAGEMPLPPYIKRPASENDRARYQTVYAEKEGAIAAPTAGLHFSEGLIKRIKEKGVPVYAVTLHVGLGSFLPVRADDILDHKMEKEYFDIPEEVFSGIMAGHRSGKRIIAVGTSTVRALESAAGLTGFTGGCGWSGLFIYPGYRFRVAGGLITNFHMPRTTPLLLTCAFGGSDLVLGAYARAVEMRYRFLSYGDSMFISD